MIAAALEEFGVIDILVNNAGIEFHVPVLNATTETWKQTMGVSLEGPYFLSCGAAANGDPQSIVGATFSSDRTVMQYANEIWRIKQIPF